MGINLNPAVGGGDIAMRCADYMPRPQREREIMISKTVLLSQAKTTAARITFLLGCIAVLALQGLGVARGQESDVRTELLNALELQSGVAESLGRADLTASLDKAIEQVLFASDADLAPLVGAIDEIQNYSGALQRLDAAIQEAAAAVEAQSIGTSSFIPTPLTTPSLTAPPYFDGGVTGILCIFPADATIGERNNTEIIMDAKNVVSAAKVALAAEKWVCEETLVGENLALLCVPLEIAVAAAEGVLGAFEMCDATVDEAHLDAAFERAEDNFDLGVAIHDDLATHDTDMKALLATLQNSVDANQQKLTQIIDLLRTPQGLRVGFPLH